MSRVNKYRGMHVHALPQNEHLNGTWIYGYLADENYINSSELEGEFLVDKDTVGQYIGVDDKNGKEIYEGDICKFFDNTYNANLLGIVKFGQYEQDGSGSEYPPTPVIGFYVEIIKYQFTEDSFYDDEDEYPKWNRKMSVLEAMDGNTYFDFEVIGNVYENVDLLEEVER